MKIVVRVRAMNLTIGAVAIALVISVLATAGKVTTSERRERELDLLSAFRQSDITRLRIERKLGGFVIERESVDDGGIAEWRITSPIQEEVEVFSMERYLGTLEFAGFERVLKPEAIHRKEMGFDDPRWVVHVDMGDIRYRLRLGKDAVSPAGSAYLEVAGENVPRKGIYIIKSSLIRELDAPLDIFRSRSLMPYLSTSLSEIHLDGDGGERRFRRAEGGGWRFDGMAADVNVDRDALDRMLLQFARTKAETFIDIVAAKKALAGDLKIKITLVPKDGSPRGTVSVGGRCPDEPSALVAVRSEPDPVAACVPASIMFGLGMSVVSLKDYSPFYLRTDEVESITIKAGKKVLDFARKEHGYTLRAPEVAEVDAAAGDRRLNTLTGSLGELIEDADLVQLGLQPAQATVVLTRVTDQEKKAFTETITVGTPATDGSVHIQRKSDGAVLKMAPEAARALRADSSLVRELGIFDFGREDIRALELRARGNHQVLTRGESSADQFVMTEPAGYPADHVLVLDLVNRLRKLRAKRWAADEDDGTFGFDTPAAVVRFSAQPSVQKDPKWHEFVVGARASDGYFAKESKSSAVFVISRRLVMATRALLINRDHFMISKNLAAKIRLSTPSATVQLIRQGKGFIQGPGQPRLFRSQIEEIIETLPYLLPRGAVHLGAPTPAEGFEQPLLLVDIEALPGHGGGSKARRFRIGNGDSYNFEAIYYARTSDIDATFVLPRQQVRRLLDALPE